MEKSFSVIQVIRCGDNAHLAMRRSTSADFAKSEFSRLSKNLGDRRGEDRTEMDSHDLGRLTRFLANGPVGSSIDLLANRMIVIRDA